MSTQEHSHSHHVVPLKYYIGTFVGLLFLTFITVFVAQFDFGAFNTAIALAVASLKASLVFLFFMGLFWDKGFNIILVVGSFIFMAIFLFFIMADVGYRGDHFQEEKGVHNLKQIVKPVGSHGGHHSESSDDHADHKKTSDTVKEGH